ncbi:MAG: peptidoglycan-associated lipoprotein Pal [Pseudomonadota bacterium]|nr:peptidoglycan-associated lipoprotein Pal [Pseudomonadota bacterium]
MSWKLIITVLAGLALVACETTPESTGSTTGLVKPSTEQNTGVSPSTGTQITSLTPQSDVQAGSQEDLVTNVGDRVFFALDSVELSVEARTTLEKQAIWLQQNLSVVATIEGHADERGTREYNLALGDRRATAARDYLVALGINQNRIQTVSFGLERPVDPRSVEEAWSKNRRGVMVVN